MHRLNEGGCLGQGRGGRCCYARVLGLVSVRHWVHDVKAVQGP